MSVQCPALIPVHVGHGEALVLTHSHPIPCQVPKELLSRLDHVSCTISASKASPMEKLALGHGMLSRR